MSAFSELKELRKVRIDLVEKEQNFVVLYVFSKVRH